MTLLTIAEIANRLNISPSTARFYRDKFDKYLPCVGEGRARRYVEETIEGFEIIIDCYKQKQPATVIESKLEECFGILTQTATEVKQQTTAVSNIENQPIAEQMLSLVIEHQKQLMAKVAEMETKLEEQRIIQIHFDKDREEERIERLKLEERLDKHDEALKNHYRLVDERLRSLSEVKEKPKSFLRRVFGI